MKDSGHLLTLSLRRGLLLNSIYGFNPIPVKILVRYSVDVYKFCEYLQTGSKTYIESQKPQNRQHNIERKNKVGGLTLLDLKTYSKAMGIKKNVEVVKKKIDKEINRKK